MTDKTKLEQVLNLILAAKMAHNDNDHLHVPKGYVGTLNEALTFYKNHLETGGWRDIESAPKDGTCIATYDQKYGELVLAAWCEWDDDGEECSGWLDIQNEENEIVPTHWQLLPPTKESE